MKTLSGAKPCVFPGIVAPGVVEVGSRFLRFRALIWQSCRQKLHRTACSKSSICTSKSQKSGGSEHFWKTRWAKCAQDCSESSTPHKKKTGTLGAARKSPHCWRCASVGRFSATLLLCGFATGCYKRISTAARSKAVSDAATLLESGIAAGGF